ncbi:hypothetical protein C8Q78DRAFT_1009866 [Trametes maxima]|nr:hypothetical protein C8Q78DRAFT_1009866 [Trametes maxima]
MASSAPSLRPDRVRLSMLLVPKEGLSLEDFRRHWIENHASLFSSLPVVKKNLLKYEQYHIDSTTTAAVARQFQQEPTAWAGQVIFEAESLEKILEVFQDEEYQRIVVPDEEKFVKRTEILPLVGQYATIVGN